MFGFFKKVPGSDKPVLVTYERAEDIVKEHCKMLIDIGIKVDPRRRSPDDFRDDDGGRSSLPYALLGVPYTCNGEKSGGRPKYIGTDICIEAIVMAMRSCYEYFKVSEERLVKLGYRYALSRN